ncbi:MAG: hypothetical protein ABII22_02365 [Candidatus Micrarchaeota archaeon]
MVTLMHQFARQTGAMIGIKGSGVWTEEKMTGVRIRVLEKNLPEELPSHERVFAQQLLKPAQLPATIEIIAPDRRSSESSPFDVRIDTQDYAATFKNALDGLISSGLALSDKFFEVLGGIAQNCAFAQSHTNNRKNDPRHDGHYDVFETAVLRAQLQILLRNVHLLADPRFESMPQDIGNVAVLAKLRLSTQHILPISGEMFTKYDEKKGYVLAPDITVEFARTAERLARNNGMWHNNRLYPLLTAMAQAVALLSKEHPMETLDARLTLLSSAIQHAYWTGTNRADGILSELVCTFRSEEELAALRRIVCDPNSGVQRELTEEVQKILSHQRRIWA